MMTCLARLLQSRSVITVSLVPEGRHGLTSGTDLNEGASRRRPGSCQIRSCLTRRRAAEIGSSPRRQRRSPLSSRHPQTSSWRSCHVKHDMESSEMTQTASRLKTSKYIHHKMVQCPRVTPTTNYTNDLVSLLTNVAILLPPPSKNIYYIKGHLLIFEAFYRLLLHLCLWALVKYVGEFSLIRSQVKFCGR